jgi:hypothetical protein
MHCNCSKKAAEFVSPVVRTLFAIERAYDDTRPLTKEAKTRPWYFIEIGCSAKRLDIQSNNGADVYRLDITRTRSGSGCVETLHKDTFEWSVGMSTRSRNRFPRADPASQTVEYVIGSRVCG